MNPPFYLFLNNLLHWFLLLVSTAHTHMEAIKEEINKKHIYEMCKMPLEFYKQISSSCEIEVEQ